MGHKDMFIYIWTLDDRQNRLQRFFAGCFGQPRRHWRGDAPARLCAADRSGTGGERVGDHSRAVATPRLAASPSPARSRSARPASRRRIGLSSAPRKRGRARHWRAPCLARLDSDDPVLARDRARLKDVRASRAGQAQKYFAEHAPVWNETRKLHAPEAEVEAAIFAAAQEQGSQWGRLLDIGCGAGRILELLSPRAENAIGVDLSPAMLGVARAQLEKSGLRNVQLRQGDIYALPVDGEVIDLAVVHQVLHYLDNPARALREAARVLAPGGRLIVVDFAPHLCEMLRENHAHRRLGFPARRDRRVILNRRAWNCSPTATLRPFRDSRRRKTDRVPLAGARSARGRPQESKT